MLLNRRQTSSALFLQNEAGSCAYDDLHAITLTLQNMRYALFTIALLALQIEVAGQVIDPAAPKTNIEKFQSRTGALLLKEYIDVAETRTLTTQVVKMTLLTERKETMSGVLMSWGTTAIGVFQQTGQAYLDSDEIDDVIKGLDSMLKMISAAIPQNYTELELSTRSGLKLTLFPSKTAWNIALERSGHRQYLYAEDLSKIRESLSAAKGKL